MSKKHLAEPTQASQEFLSILSSKLCLLEHKLELGVTSMNCAYDSEDPHLKKIKKRYSEFLKRLSNIEGITDSVIIHAFILSKKVSKILQESFIVKQGEFFEIFLICCFLSIKYVVDVFKWFLSDFAMVSKLNEKKIQRMEIFVLHNLLRYKLCTSESEYLSAYSKIYQSVDKKKETKCVTKYRSYQDQSSNQLKARRLQ